MTKPIRLKKGDRVKIITHCRRGEILRVTMIPFDCPGGSPYFVSGVFRFSRCIVRKLPRKAGKGI